jgi:hypothetical protein
MLLTIKSGGYGFPKNRLPGQGKSKRRTTNTPAVQTVQFLMFG